MITAMLQVPSKYVYNLEDRDFYLKKKISANLTPFKMVSNITAFNFYSFINYYFCKKLKIEIFNAISLREQATPLSM